MSLFSQKKPQDWLWIYFYIIVSGFSSLLMFFLIKESLSFNQQKAKEYQQDIHAAKQEVFDLERKLLQSKYSTSELDNSLDLQWSFTNPVISKLQETPKFLNQEQQNILKSKLETEAAFNKYENARNEWL